MIKKVATSGMVRERAVHVCQFTEINSCQHAPLTDMFLVIIVKFLAQVTTVKRQSAYLHALFDPPERTSLRNTVFTPLVKNLTEDEFGFFEPFPQSTSIFALRFCIGPSCSVRCEHYAYPSLELRDRDIAIW
jgi:hypothetical protein